MKKVKHVWWEYLIYKYKYIETEDSLEEYRKLRLWSFMLRQLFSILISPIVIVLYWIVLLKNTIFTKGDNDYMKTLVWRKNPPEENQTTNEAE